MPPHGRDRENWNENKKARKKSRHLRRNRFLVASWMLSWIRIAIADVCAQCHDLFFFFFSLHFFRPPNVSQFYVWIFNVNESYRWVSYTSTYKWIYLVDSISCAICLVPRFWCVCDWIGFQFCLFIGGFVSAWVRVSIRCMRNSFVSFYSFIAALSALRADSCCVFELWLRIRMYFAVLRISHLLNAEWTSTVWQRARH